MHGQRSRIPFLRPQSKHFSPYFATTNFDRRSPLERWMVSAQKMIGGGWRGCGLAVSTVLFTPPIFPSFKFIVVCVRYPATVIREESRHARMKL